MRRENFSDLAVFLTVAEERSFTRAANKLGTSQSAVSQVVRRVEDSMGLKLLTRTTRNVALTDAGEQLVETLRPAFADIQSRITGLSALREKPSGFVRITAGRHAAEALIWPAVQRVIHDNPDITIELSIDQALTDIVTERFDAGVRLGEEVAKDMVAVKIGPDLRLAVVGSPSYFAEHGVPLSPHELTEHRCVNIRQSTKGGFYVWEFEKDGREVNVRVEGPLILNDSSMIYKAAEQGLGLACVMEDLVGDQIASCKLVRVLQDWCPPFAGYHLYYPDRRQITPAFGLLMAALRYKG
jgi:DNA-binding transcriptional LysR family regulator